MRMLSQRETDRLLTRFSIPSPKQALAKSEQEAATLSRRMGFPVVMKVSSPDIIHKTDANCVIVNIKDSTAAMAAYKQIGKNARKHKPKAKVDGVAVFEMVPSGTREVIIGAKQDPQFGPVLMFGLGGILVEVLKDVSFRLVPLTKKDAKEMVREIRGFRILEGVRGKGPVDFEKLESTILKVSRLVEANKRIKELDINPLFIDENRVWAADVRILV